MSNNVRTQIGKVVGKSLDAYHKRMKPTVDELKFKEQYQGRIIDCMVGEVDDNYIETPETDAPIVKLEHSKEGVVKIPSIKGKTILVDADGNETDTPAEGCRLVSVGEQEDNKLIILSKNKNLFKGKLELGSINEYGDNTNNVSRVRSIDFTEINQNTQLVFSTLQSFAKYFVYYNEKKECIIRVYSSASKKNILSIPDGAKYLKVCLVNCADINTQVQLEVGNIETFYVEPKHHKTEILLDEPLRSLSNGVYDEIVGNKKITRLEKLKVTEDIHFNSHAGWENDEFLAIFFNPIGNKRADRTYFSSNVFKSMRFSECTVSGVIVKECVRTDSQAFYVFIKKNRLETPNIEGFKKWVKENNLEIVYEIAEPIIEELPNGITLQGYDDTTIYIENSITPIVSYGYNALIPYKEELSQQKEEVEINTLDIENNIIPYLMDMEFNLMTMEDNE